MARLRGRAPKGERCRAPVPHGHWKTTTFTAGLRLGGLDAPMLLDGPMNGTAFLAYVRQVLVPVLKPGDVVVMDNRPAHKSLPQRKLGSPACARPSKEHGHGSSTSRPIRPTPDQVRGRLLIPSSSPSQSLKRCSEKPPPEPSTTSGTPSPPASMPSHRMNAPTTSLRQAMTSIKVNLL